MRTRRLDFRGEGEKDYPDPSCNPPDEEIADSAPSNLSFISQ